MSGFGGFGAFGEAWNNDAEGEDEAELEPSEYISGRDGLIFLIDCTKPMYEASADGCGLELALRCAKTVYQNKIISSENDILGVVFFATEKTENTSGFKHIYVMQDLDLLNSKRVKELEEILDDIDGFEKKCGHSSGYLLSEVFWMCSNLFSKCPHKLGFKRILLFTNNDNPQGGNKQLQTQAQAKVTDLRETGIDLELMHMTPPGGGSFDVDRFYSSILYYADDEAATLPDASARFDELLTRVRSKEHKKRTLCKIPFTIAPGLELSVGVYNLVRRAREPYYARLYKRTNEELKTSVRVFGKATGEVLMPMDMKCYQSYASKRIVFENEEKASVKKFDLHGLRLMGFRPRQFLKHYYYVKPASFVYPDERSIRGSTTLFCALLKKCLDRDVMPICWYSPRSNSSLELVALLPQAEELDSNKVQVTPPGFHVLFLPFAEDFRSMDLPETPRATNEQVDKAKAVIKGMQFKFQSESFENPALQTFYSHLEAMALDKDAPERVKDYTEPDLEQIEQRCGRALEEFKAATHVEGDNPVSNKRAEGATAAGAVKAKKVKEEPDTELDVAVVAREGKLNKLTVAVLKEIIKKNKIKTSATRKDDLMNAINKHFGTPP